TVGWCYMITAVTFAYSSVLRGTGYVRVPMVVSITALSLKTFLNFGLIFGNFGLPAMGIQGAALSTVFARTLECILMLSISYIKKLPPAAKPRELFGFDRPFLTKVLKTALPVLVNEMLWSFGITTYNMVYGRIGTDAIAAVNIAASIENLVFVVFMGVSEATGIMIGHRIGAGEEHRAFGYARQTLIITNLGAMALGGIIILTANMVLSLYKLSPAALANARSILLVIGLLLWIRVGNMTVIVGILRAGGDTRFGMILDAGTVWLVGVPLALMGGLVLHLPVYVVYLMVMAEEAVKYAIGLWRVRSRKWVHNLVKAPAELEAVQTG
ncbi:MAG: MATE family efflux transporter, partial [Chloroflexi bacterium]